MLGVQQSFFISWEVESTYKLFKKCWELLFVANFSEDVTIFIATWADMLIVLVFCWLGFLQWNGSVTGAIGLLFGSYKCCI